MPLTPKQQRFVEEYLIDLNGTQAAIRAGYSPKTANQQATRLLANAHIQAALQARRAAISERLEITTEMVASRLWTEANRVGGDATHSGRVQALNTLAKTLGMLTDRLRLEGEVKVHTPPPLNLAGMNDTDLGQLVRLLERAVPPPGPRPGGPAPRGEERAGEA